MDALAHQTHDYAHEATQEPKLPRSANDNEAPLVVDLDGTLIKTDLLFESVLSLIKRKPAYLLLLPFWLIAGKANLKRQIALRTQIDVRLLPYNDSLVDFLKSEHQKGRQLILATGADEHLANDVAEYLGVFDEVMASDGSRSLTGSRKRDCLLKRFAAGSFDYIGNELRDLAIWRVSRRCHAVALPSRLRKQIEREIVIDSHFEKPGNLFGPLVKAIRPHQWSKNLLVLAPALAAQMHFTPSVIGAAVLAFIAFSLAASSAYVLNDMLDLEADRRHPRKRNRPFASGAVPLSRGLWLSPLLLVASVTIALHLPPQFLLVLACYLALTLAYSFLSQARRPARCDYAIGLVWRSDPRWSRGDRGRGLIIHACVLALYLLEPRDAENASPSWRTLAAPTAVS